MLKNLAAPAPPPYDRIMQGTRSQVLELVISRREVRAEELAGELGISAVAVRRHLDLLRADGLVEIRAVKQATGRPYHLFLPTEKALGTMPQGYADLLERVLRSVEERGDVTNAVAERMAESVASRHLGDFPAAANAEERIVQVTASLKEEGILDHWHNGEDGFHLVNCTCPYRMAAEMSKLPCESDRKAIELLVGAEVLQVHRIVDGDSCCEYVVRPVGTEAATTTLSREAGNA
jgi:predicted ArsR family transcriptional regulator